MDISNENEKGQGKMTLQDAREGTESEQKMTLREGLKLYPKAMAWSVLFSSAIIMEGFGIVLLGSFYAFPQFVGYFGDLNADGTTTITPAWQAGLSNGALIGQLFGLWLNGIVSERYGYRKTMMVSLTLMAGTVFIPFFAPNLPVLLVGELAMGCCWGVFQTLAPAYASEVCPVALRGYLTTYVNLCWVMGQLLASGVLRALLSRQDVWAFRIPFALQWIWPLPIAIGCFLAPESPWWLVRHGKSAEARNALLRLTCAKAGDKNFNVDATLAMITHTNELEKSASAGTSYFDCFKGVDRRRTEIACAAWMTQNLCGSAFMGYSTYFLTQAGLATEAAFSMSLAQYAIGAIGTMGSWVLMGYFGRRTLYIVGLVIMTCFLFIIGFLGIAPEENTSVTWAVGGMLLAYTFDITVGPVCYAIVAEISSTRLRSKTIVLARLTYNLVGVVNSVIMPYFLNEQALNWKAKTGFFWAGWATVCAVYCYYRLPETKGKTYGELDMLFLQMVRARDFKTTEVDQYKEHDMTGSVADEIKKPVQIEHVE